MLFFNQPPLPPPPPANPNKIFEVLNTEFLDIEEDDIDLENDIEEEDFN